MSTMKLDIIGNSEDGYLSRCLNLMCINHGKTPEEARERFFKEVSNRYTEKDFSIQIYHVRANGDGTFTDLNNPQIVYGSF